MPDSDEILDARGLVCPEPLMLVRNRIRTMAAGAQLRVVATDPSTERDLANFCRFMNHEMVEHGRDGGEFFFVIRRGP